MRLRHLDASDVSLIARIDRSEHVDVPYAVRDGQLVEAPVFTEDIPTWPDDDGEHDGLARGTGAASMYVSATPPGSAVGFCLSQRRRLADPAHPVLFEHEPEDIHLVCELRQP